MSTPKLIPSKGALRHLRSILALETNSNSKPIASACATRKCSSVTPRRLQTVRPEKWQKLLSSQNRRCYHIGIRDEGLYESSKPAESALPGQAQQESEHVPGNFQPLHLGLSATAYNELPAKQRSSARKGRRRRPATAPELLSSSGSDGTDLANVHNASFEPLCPEEDELTTVEDLIKLRHFPEPLFPFPVGLDHSSQRRDYALYYKWAQRLYKRLCYDEVVAGNVRKIDELVKVNDPKLTVDTLVSMFTEIMTSSYHPRRMHANYLFIDAQSRLPKRLIRSVALFLVNRQSKWLEDEPRILFHLIDWTKVEPQHAQLVVYEYLRRYAIWYKDPEKVRDETHRVIHALTRLNLSPTLGLSVPLLRSLIEADCLSQAYKELVELEEQYPHLLFSNSPYLVLIFASSRHQQWSDIESIFQYLHDNKAAREMPSGVSHLFTKAFNTFTHHNSPSSVYDFLLSTMATCGLVPTRELYADVVSYFIRHGQINYLSRWVEERHRHFPNLLIPLHAPQVGLAIVKALEDSPTGPSCVYMLECFKALLHGLPRVEINHTSQNLLLHAIKVDLTQRAFSLHRLMAQTAANLTIKPFNQQPLAFLHQFKDHNAALDYSAWVVGLRFHQQSRYAITPRVFIAVQDLQQTLLAAEELVMILQNYNGYIAAHGLLQRPILPREIEPRDPSSASGSTTHHFWPLQHRNLSDQHVALQDLVFAEALWEDLLEALTQYINVARTLDISDLTTPIVGVMRALGFFGRWHAARRMLYHIHDHESWLSQSPLQLDLFRAWLECASSLLNRAYLADALWHLLNHASAVPITPQFLAFAELCMARLHRADHDRGNRALDLSQVRETKYLVNRLYRVMWHQLGRPSPADAPPSLDKHWLVLDSPDLSGVSASTAEISTSASSAALGGAPTIEAQAQAIKHSASAVGFRWPGMAFEEGPQPAGHEAQ